MTAYLNLIGNQWLAAEDGATFAVDNPATEVHFATVSAASTAQVLQACDQAAAAQRGWRKLTSVARGAHLHKLADALVARSAQIGRALAQEAGKSLQDATDEAVYAAEVTRYHAEWARRIEGEIIPSDSPRVGNKESGFIDGVIIFNFAPNSIGIGTWNPSGIPKASATPCIV